MRNILVFPDGSKTSFMYPDNRDIEIGTKLKIQLADGRVDVLTVSDIQKKEKEIHYILSF